MSEMNPAPIGADSALARLVAAVEAETAPDWVCNSYHPSLWPALKAARAALASAAQPALTVTARYDLSPAAICGRALPQEDCTVKDALTREQWLARCATVYDCGLARLHLMRLMREWFDALMRYEHTQFSDGQGQGKDWLRFLQSEFERTGQGSRTLANDADGYGLQQIAAILCHPCQQCAEDKDAWHTRSGFCDHRNRSET